MKLWTIVLLVALVPVAGAQGPAPGYESAAEYAVDHAGSEAQNASSDPVAYAQDHASPEAVQEEIDHTLYVACWAADDHGVQHAACDPYYTPRGKAAPEQPASNDTSLGNDTASDALNETHAFVDEIIEAVNDTVADPSSAPSQVERIIAATTGFLGDLADRVAQAVEDLLGGLAALGTASDALADAGLAAAQAMADASLAVADGLAAGSKAATDGLHGATGAVADAARTAGGAVASATGDALGAAGSAVADASSAAGSALADGAKAAGAGLADGAQAAGRGLADGAKAAGHGVASAAKAAGHGVASAAKAAGGAIADAASALRDAVTGVFEGTGPAPETDLPAAPDPVADGLLDGLPSLLE